MGAKPKANYSVDENAFHTSYESGMLEDENCSPDDSMFKMTVSPQAAPDQPEDISIEFQKGIPIKITNASDGTDLTDPLDIFLYCNKIAGKHGIGRIDIVENRFVGIKSRGVYETPGGTILREAHLDLEGICMDREVKRISETLSAEFARLCYYGFWFAPDMDMEDGGDNFDYNPADAQGFIRINATRLKTYAA